MSHDYHEKLPGFHPDQILKDGCAECEQRSESRDRGIANLDTANFERAWERAKCWNQGGLATVSAAEAPLLSVLWSVYLQFERVGMGNVLAASRAEAHQPAATVPA